MAQEDYTWIATVTGDVWVEMWGGGYLGQDGDPGGFGASGGGGGGGAYSRRKISVVMGSTYYLYVIWNLLDSLTQFRDTDDSTSLADVMNGGTAVNAQFPGSGAGGMLSGYDAEFSGGWGGNRTVGASAGGGGGAGGGRTGDAPFPASSPPFPYNGQPGTVAADSFGGSGGDPTPTNGGNGYRGGGGGGGGWSGAVAALGGSGGRGGIAIYNDSAVFDPATAVLIEAFGDVEPLPPPNPKLRKSAFIV